jgi:hypothetical protein
LHLCPESEPDEIILINFENSLHYNLLKVKGQNIETQISNKTYNAIININFEIKSNILSQKNTIYFKDDENKTNTKYINAGEKQNYYDDLYIFLSSIEKVKIINEFNETKILWNLVKNPKDLVDDKMKQSTKKKNLIVGIKLKIIFWKIIVYIFYWI